MKKELMALAVLCCFGLFVAPSVVFQKPVKPKASVRTIKHQDMKFVAWEKRRERAMRRNYWKAHKKEALFECVWYVKNYDGDTLTIRIPELPDVFGDDLGIRVGGVDTPELRGKCDREKELARAARDVVRYLLENSECITLTNLGRDKYFRLVADVDIDGLDLKTFLIDNRLGVPYSGGRKDSRWCEDTE